MKTPTLPESRRKYRGKVLKLNWPKKGKCNQRLGFKQKKGER
jgi:hypothetical protein